MVPKGQKLPKLVHGKFEYRPGTILQAQVGGLGKRVIQCSLQNVEPNVSLRIQRVVFLLLARPFKVPIGFDFVHQSSGLEFQHKAFDVCSAFDFRLEFGEHLALVVAHKGLSCVRQWAGDISREKPE